MTGFLLWPASYSGFPPPLQEVWALSLGQSPDLRLMLPPHLWGWQRPRASSSTVFLQVLGALFCQIHYGLPQKRKQNLDLKVSLWAIPILGSLECGPNSPGKWKKEEEQRFCVPHGVASNQDRIISGAQKSLHTPKFLPYLLTDAWNYFHRKQHALFHN